MDKAVFQEITTTLLNPKYDLIRKLCPSISAVRQHVMLFDGIDKDQKYEKVQMKNKDKTKDFTDVKYLEKPDRVGTNISQLTKISDDDKKELNDSVSAADQMAESTAGMYTQDIIFSIKQEQEAFAATFCVDSTEIWKDQESPCSLIDFEAFRPCISDEVIKKNQTNEEVGNEATYKTCELTRDINNTLLIAPQNSENDEKSAALQTSCDIKWSALTKITEGQQATPYPPSHFDIDTNILDEPSPSITRNDITMMISDDSGNEEITISNENDSCSFSTDDATMSIIEQVDLKSKNPIKTKIKPIYPHVKKSKKILGKVGIIDNLLDEEEEQITQNASKQDPFNISDDIYYAAKPKPRVAITEDSFQHSTPVVEIQAPFVPTYLSVNSLRRFHRPCLKNPCNLPQPILDIRKQYQKKAKERELERISSGGGYVFYMRQPEDLSAKDGDIILAEFTEEHPPLMNWVGMCSKIKIYYKQTKNKENSILENFQYGELTAINRSPFLGIIKPNEFVQTFENKLYRAPIYQHNMPQTDFLVIRTQKNKFWIREINTIYAVGQECPFVEVPAPKSKTALTLSRNILQAFIYRLFRKNGKFPPQLRMKDIQESFPNFTESFIRKRLKKCSKFFRTGSFSNYWVMKQDFRLPTEEEIRAIISPEQCCAYFSMLAAKQRLNDAGYGEMLLFLGDDYENSQSKMDDEVKAAPWNTTRAFIAAMQGKCLLQINGQADPTGCGQGFSYIKVSNKPKIVKQQQEESNLISGTDADLRRLSLKDAKEMLLDLNIPEEETRDLSRWGIIDLLRTLSTEKTKAGEEGMDKFSRGSRHSINEHHERYKFECQRIFNLQNRILSSREILSTDENESSSSSSEDYDEIQKHKTNCLQKPNDGKNLPKKRILKITRTYKDENGCEFQRIEIVRNAAIIDGYHKIRTTKNINIIKQYSPMEEEKMKMLRREKRNLQEKIRRLKSYEQHSKPFKEKEKILKKEMNKKCGACGQMGHMKTNKECPRFEKNSKNFEQKKKTKRHCDNESSNGKEFVNFKNTKTKRKRSSLHCDYLELEPKIPKRRCTDPKIILSLVFQNILSELRRLPEIEPFMFPVKAKLVPDYYEIITNPMDFREIRRKIQKNHYHSFAGFLADVNQILENSKLYNGPEHDITSSAQLIFDTCKSKIIDRHKELFDINEPDNLQELITDVMKNILIKLESAEESTKIFIPKEDVKKKKNSKICANEMNLLAMFKQIQNRQYISRLDFLTDLKSIVTSCEQHNGRDPAITKEARVIFDYAQDALEKNLPKNLDNSDDVIIIDDDSDD